MKKKEKLIEEKNLEWNDLYKCLNKIQIPAFAGMTRVPRFGRQETMVEIKSIKFAQNILDKYGYSPAGINSSAFIYFKFKINKNETVLKSFYDERNSKKYFNYYLTSKFNSQKIKNLFQVKHSQQNIISNNTIKLQKNLVISNAVNISKIPGYNFLNQYSNVNNSFSENFSGLINYAKTKTINQKENLNYKNITEFSNYKMFLHKQSEQKNFFNEFKNIFNRSSDIKTKLIESLFAQTSVVNNNISNINKTAAGFIVNNSSKVFAGKKIANINPHKNYVNNLSAKAIKNYGNNIIYYTGRSVLKEKDSLNIIEHTINNLIHKKVNSSEPNIKAEEKIKLIEKKTVSSETVSVHRSEIKKIPDFKIDLLADEVYSILEKRISIEKDRKGLL